MSLKPELARLSQHPKPHEIADRINRLIQWVTKIGSLPSNNDAVTAENLVNSGSHRYREKQLEFVLASGVPQTPTGVVAVGTHNGIFIYWNYPTYDGHWYTQIIRNTSESINGATLIGVANTRTFEDPLVNVSPFSTYFYGIRHVNRLGTPGPYRVVSASSVFYPEFFNRLTITSVDYTGTQVDQINYSGGYKIVISYYPGTTKVSTAEYYDSDGVTVLATLTLTYSGDDLSTAVWS